MGSAVVDAPETTQPTVSSGSADHVAGAQPDVDSGESLTGMRLVSCLAALLMCIFVVALDMVSPVPDGQVMWVG